MTTVRHPEETRSRILESALELFHQGSFKGTSINQIVEKAGITKGALFHHFKSKNELGYAIVDELLHEEVQKNWAQPLATSVDPITDIMAIIQGFSQQIEEDPTVMECGCPINNLSQEMSTADETFRLKLKAVYQGWQDCLERALRAGVDAGNVSAECDPEIVATFLVAQFEGSIGTMKVYRSQEHMERIGKGIGFFLNSLRPAS